MKWGIQSTLISETDQRALLEEIKKQGLDWFEVPMMPFAEGLPEMDVSKDDIVVFYGSCSLCRLAHEAGYKPGVFFDPTTFNYRWSLENNGDKMLNYGSRFAKIRDLRYETFPEIAFIRPNNDHKAFAGELITRDEFLTWQGRLSMHGLDEYSDLEVVIGRPKNILQEYRAFVINNTVVDVTRYVDDTATGAYRQRGKVQISRIDNEPIKERIEEYIKNIVTPHEAVVVDVAIVDESSLLEGEDDMKIIEFNTLNGSGFYDHDLGKIVKAVTEYVNEQEQQV